MHLTVSMGRYCPSGPLSSDNSMLTKLSVMPFCHGAAECYPINPCYPEGFVLNIFSEGGCCNPLDIINTEGHITLNLLPVYRYGHPLSTDTKISTNH